jgi:hypothetical protein
MKMIRPEKKLLEVASRKPRARRSTPASLFQQRQGHPHPYSFIYSSDEAETLVPLVMYLARQHDGGRFAHGIAGGVDIYSVVTTTPFVSLEVLLYRGMPPWLATACHKVVVVGLGFSGAYLLARRLGGADRLTAVALAFNYTLAHRYMLQSSVHGGISYSIGAMALYLLVGRIQKPGYWAGAGGVSVAHAVSTTPTLAAPALAFALLLGWLATGARRPARFAMAILILAGVALANWGETMFAVLQTASESHLISRDVGIDLSILPLRLYKYFDIGRSPEAAAMIVSSLAVLLMARSSRFLPSFTILAIANGLGPLLLVVPWDEFGLGALRAYDYFYLNFALAPLSILVGAWASAGTLQKVQLRRAFQVALLALAFGQFSWLKAFNVASWVGFGGETVFTAYSNLSDRTWAPNHPFRVVTIPYRLSPNITATYGLESFDGAASNYLLNRAQFWADSFPATAFAIRGGLTYVTNHDAMDFLCCRTYELARYVDIDRLRLGNVEYLVSDLPLQHKDIVLVSGPATGTVPPRRGDTMREKISGLITRLFNDTPAYVYKIEGSLPRAYVASRVVTSQVIPSDSAYFQFTTKEALDGAVVISAFEEQSFPKCPSGDFGGRLSRLDERGT